MVDGDPGRRMEFGELREHWPVLVPCMLGLALASLQGFSLGVLIHPIEQEFGWSRAEITLGPFIIACMALLGGPLAGALIDRGGPRRVALAGVALYCGALAFLGAVTSSLLTWWAGWVLLGFAAPLVLATVWMTAINSVFSRNRGMAIALALCGTGVGAAVAPPLTNLLLVSHGWRGAYIGLAVISALLVVPAVLFLFHSPADRRGGAVARKSEAAVLAGFSAREGFTSPTFIKLTLAVLLFGMTSIALTANAVPVMISKGVNASAAAGLAALIGIGSITGRLIGGFLLDRFDAKFIAGGSVFAPILSSLLLLLLPDRGMTMAAACFLLGIAAGTEVDACSYLAARHFGMRSFGALFGTMNGVVLFGGGIAPLVANHVYDVTHSYDALLIGMIPTCLVSAGLFLSLGRYPHFGDVAAQSPCPDASEPAPAVAFGGNEAGGTV